MARFRVDPATAGRRLDRWLAGALPGCSVAGARRLIAAGAVRLDGRSPRKGDRTTDGQTIEIEDGAIARGQPEAGRVIAEAGAALEILAVDDAFVAIAKPAGIPSHPRRPGETGTAANAIVARFPECAGASPDPREAGLVHRLDTATSGVLLAARTAPAWSQLRAALTGPECEKTYLAEVAGAPPDSGESREPIGRVGRRGARVRVGGGRQPLAAHTSWQVLERRPAGALLRVELHQGRAHQVRAHLAAAGYPIVGDPLYGGGEPGGLRLHAASVRFIHPSSGAAILIEAPPPDWAMMRGG